MTAVCRRCGGPMMQIHVRHRRIRRVTVHDLCPVCLTTRRRWLHVVPAGRPALTVVPTIRRPRAKSRVEGGGG